MQKIFYVIRSGSSFGIQISKLNFITEHSRIFFPYSNWKQKHKMENGPYKHERLRLDYFNIFF